MVILLQLFVLALSAQNPSFDTEVRPILERNCFGCHNSKLKLSNFSLSTRTDILNGGKRGPAIVPGNAKDSRLLQVVRHEGTLRMPPSSQLSAREIGILDRWVASGANMPETAISQPPPKPNHWAFHKPVRPALPPVKNSAWVRTPIDRFILSKLEAQKITPSPEASPATLLRRAWLDVVGLAPPPGANNSIDALLASPHYGERWGRHWLDQARYADSDGGSRDEPRQIWRYRDWVIQALNRDMPFDQFAVEQLAGDLLPNPTNDQLIATGFHRNSPIQIEAGTDREQYRVEAVIDRVETTGNVFLGMSVGCARCHDHKFDPISHREYYQFFAFFNSTDDWSESRPRFNPKFNNLIHVHGPLLEFATPDVIRQRDETLAKLLELDEQKNMQAAIAELKKKLPGTIEGSMIMRELATPRATHIMLGGDYLRPGERVTPGTPAFLNSFPAKENATRLDFARWLVSPENPLLARVTVNRIWQQYFGRGIVETENDFGTQSSAPTHRELLDWLAVEFIESGWSQKHIHRLILNSAVYRQSSKVREDLMEIDPLNLLLARQTRLRLDGEIVRDVALSASGLLNAKVGGPSVFPPQPEGAMTASQVKKTWKPSTGPDRYRRGMYTFFWRVTPHPALMVFDTPGAMNTCTRRTRSNTPLQALALLNETAFYEFAQAFAERIQRDAAGGDRQRLAYAFRVALGRDANPREMDRLQTLLNSEPDHGWTSVARVLMNTDEFITRE